MATTNFAASGTAFVAVNTGSAGTIYLKDNAQQFGDLIIDNGNSDSAQVTALRETSVVWGALIAFFFLHERLGPRRWLGAAIVAFGAGLIAFA